MPHKVKDLYSLALDFEIKGMRKEALETYEKVLALDPNHVGATNGRKRVHDAFAAGMKSVEKFEGVIEIDIEKAKEKISGLDYPVSNELLLKQKVKVGEKELTVLVSWQGDVSKSASYDGSWVSGDGYLSGGYHIQVIKGDSTEMISISSGLIVYDETIYPTERYKLGYEFKSATGPLVRIRGLWPPPVCDAASSAKQENDES